MSKANETILSGMREMGPNLSGKVVGDYLVLAVHMAGTRQESKSGKSDLIAKAPLGAQIAYGDEIAKVNLQVYVPHPKTGPQKADKVRIETASTSGLSDEESALLKRLLSKAGA